jgi:hypothetical protein
MVDQTVFVTLARTVQDRSYARMLIDSIRSFGGALSQCSIRVFEADPQEAPRGDLGAGVQVIPLSTPETVRGYAFADKVWACARAEELATSEVRSLVWIDPVCLVIQPPVLFDLAPSWSAAVRPVHIQNVGLGAREPLDGFWGRVYEAVGVRDIETRVETFVDGARIRSYFNSHAFAVDPSARLLRRWFEQFEALVCDQEFQARSCQDELHQVFLHQALLSALLVTSLAPSRIRVLPPEYNYPYNLHQSVPADRRALSLNDLVCITYEDRSIDPRAVDDIDIHEPLRSWLSTRAAL